MENFILWLPPHVPAHNSKHENIFFPIMQILFSGKE